TEVLAWGEHAASMHDFDDRLSSSKRDANRMPFTELLKVCNARLTKPLGRDDELISLQKVRNCLEHRHGVVGKQDGGPDGVLRLTFPRLVIVLKKPDGTEVDMGRGFKT